MRIEFFSSKVNKIFQTNQVIQHNNKLKNQQILKLKLKPHQTQLQHKKHQHKIHKQTNK